MSESDEFTAYHDGLLEIARRTTDALKPQWEARRDISKTLISLASAALAVTVALKSSLIQPATPAVWRYALIACWLAFICSLAFALLSLWFSIGLHDFQGQLMIKISELKKLFIEGRKKQPPDLDPVHAVMDRSFQVIVRKDKLTRRFGQAALIAYGVALVIFIAVGLRHIAA